jgi:CelD/BcsL family acetyltransferase involved in cellulose biosynthesis
LKSTLQPTAGITVQVVNEVDALRGLAPEWERLWRQTPEVSAFQALEWVLAWAAHRADPNASCFAMVLRADGEALAIFPTRLGPRGALSFIGAEVSNYCGPVYAPGALPSVVKAWCDAVSTDPRIRCIDLTGLRERSPFLHLLAQTAFPGWGRPAIVEMTVCPEVDLEEGWDRVFRRHKSRQRANWRRKWDSLAKLGQLEFLQTSDPDELAAAFPRLLQLYDARWRGKRIRAWSGTEQRRLQLEAAKALAARRLVKLSLLRLDGEIIAFAYALRGVAQSTSYILAHDAVFDVFSPGLLLLLKILEAAAAEGDTYYDFSLGHQPYKVMWATREQRVFSALLGRRVAPTAIWRRWRSVARSIPLLRRLKQEGARRLDIWKDRRGVADQPGLAAGTAELWRVCRVNSTPQPVREPRCRLLRYAEMRAMFSPQLLRLALDRHFRGDQALAVERQGGVVGAIWKVAQHRRPIVTGGYRFELEPSSVYYHPVASEDGDLEQVVLGVGTEEVVVVTPRPLAGTWASEIYTFRGDLWFRGGAGLEDSCAAAG